VENWPISIHFWRKLGLELRGWERIEFLGFGCKTIREPGGGSFNAGDGHDLSKLRDERILIYQEMKGRMVHRKLLCVMNEEGWKLSSYWWLHSRKYIPPANSRHQNTKSQLRLPRHSARKTGKLGKPLTS
jgi:hypothetical protein